MSDIPPIPAHAQDDFLRELSALSRKHNIAIGGCGCCSSPWIEPLANLDPDGHYVLNKGYVGELRYILPGDYYWKDNT